MTNVEFVSFCCLYFEVDSVLQIRTADRALHFSQLLVAQGPLLALGQEMPYAAWYIMGDA